MALVTLVARMSTASTKAPTMTVATQTKGLGSNTITIMEVNRAVKAAKTELG